MRLNRLNIVLPLLALFLSGCISTYEEEYQAALREIDSLKLELAQTKRKLKAADNDTRHKIFTLARRANNHLLASKIDPVELRRVQQELSVHLDSYTQLNGSADQVSLVASFYSDKLDRILILRRDSRRAYDRQYNACLSDLDGQGNKNDLSTMLCEVQADVARKGFNENLIASIAALNKVGRELLNGARQDGVASMSPEQAEVRFQETIENAKRRP